MEEIVRLVQERTGLSEENSRKAAEVVIAYLKDKLPPPIAGQLDNLIGGEGGGGMMGGLSGGLGGLLGKK